MRYLMGHYSHCSNMPCRLFLLLVGKVFKDLFYFDEFASEQQNPIILFMSRWSCLSMCQCIWVLLTMFIMSWGRKYEFFVNPLNQMSEKSYLNCPVYYLHKADQAEASEETNCPSCFQLYMFRSYNKTDFCYIPTTPSLSLKVALTSFSITFTLGSTIWMVSFTTSFAYFSSQTTFASSIGRPNSRFWMSLHLPVAKYYCSKLDIDNIQIVFTITSILQGTYESIDLAKDRIHTNPKPND